MQETCKYNSINQGLYTVLRYQGAETLVSSDRSQGGLRVSENAWKSRGAMLHLCHCAETQPVLTELLQAGTKQEHSIKSLYVNLVFNLLEIYTLWSSSLCLLILTAMGHTEQKKSPQFH